MTVYSRNEGTSGHFRASHADREQVIEVLKVAFVQGRLFKDELDARVGQALASRTYAQLDVLTSDIPRGTGAEPARPAARAGAPAHANVRPRDPAIIASVTFGGLALVASVLLTGSPLAALAFLAFLGSTFASLYLLSAQMRHAPEHLRPGGPAPRNPTLGNGPCQSR